MVNQLTDPVVWTSPQFTGPVINTIPSTLDSQKRVMWANHHSQMSTVITHDVCGNDVGGLLGHPPLHV